MKRFWAAALITLGMTLSAHAKPDCFDIAVIGKIIDQRNFVQLDEVSSDKDRNTARWGGQYDLRISVERVLVGQYLPSKIWIRAIMTDLPSRESYLLFFLAREAGELYSAKRWFFTKRNEDGQFVLPEDSSRPIRCSEP